MRPKINKKTSFPIINKIESLIKKSSHIPYSEVIKLMIKAETNLEIDVKKQLENITKPDNKL